MKKYLSKIGEEHTTNSGLKIVITEHINSANCTIQFEDGSILTNIQYSNIKSGSIRKEKTKIGEKHITSEGYEVEVIKYLGRQNCTIKFNNGLELDGLQYSNIKRGKVKNPYHKSVYGVGYLGEGEFLIQKSCSKCSTWRNIISRCYSGTTQEKHPTYKNCSVDERWHNFQNFAKWYEENYISEWHLDKDILFKGNKIYSPQTCCFVPAEINTLFVKNNIRRGDSPIGVFKTKSGKFSASINKYGTLIHLGTFDTIEEAFQIYKTTKEVYIKKVADEWRPLIKPRVYDAMYAYEVEITD